MAPKPKIKKPRAPRAKTAKPKTAAKAGTRKAGSRNGKTPPETATETAISATDFEPDSAAAEAATEAANADAGEAAEDMAEAAEAAAEAADEAAEATAWASRLQTAPAPSAQETATAAVAAAITDESDTAQCSGSVSETPAAASRAGNGHAPAPGYIGGVATNFLAGMFGNGRTTADVWISSLANSDARDREVGERHVATRETDATEGFIRKWDRKDRALYFCTATVKPGATTRSKKTLDELNGLHVDIDFNAIAITPKQAKQKLLQGTALLLSKGVHSGNGLHGYWLFKNALPATEENIARVEALLRLLADHLGGDPACCEAARLMRLPGSHNTKDGAWIEVRLITDNDVTYTLEELEDWLKHATPLIQRKVIDSDGNGSVVENPYLAFGERFSNKPPIDVETRLSAMIYQGVGDSGIHNTQVSVSAALLNRGFAVDEIVESLLAATHVAAGKAGERWNWQREDRKIRGMCTSWLEKHPEILDEQSDDEAVEDEAAKDEAAKDEAAKDEAAKDEAAKADTTAQDDDPEWDTDWPEISQVAFHGLAGELVTCILPHTESDPVALLANFLISFGNVIGRVPYYTIEATPNFTNLFGLMVGKTSHSRKGTAADRIRPIFHIVDREWEQERIKSGLSSGEGVIYQIRDAVYSMKKGQLELTDPGIDDKRLLLDEREFSKALRTLKRDNSIQSEILRDLWDCRKKVGSLTKHSPTSATDPYVSLMGHITPGELRDLLDHVSMANGYANRFLFFCVRRSKLLPHGGALDDEVSNALGEKISQALDFARGIERITMTSAAHEYWKKIYTELASVRMSEFLNVLTARAAPSNIRLAMIYALLDRKQQIDVVHLDAALAVWKFCAASVRHIFGNTLGNPAADTILHALKSAGANGMTRLEIVNLFGRNLAANKIDMALFALLKAGKIRNKKKPSTGGRPAEIWFAV